MILITDDETTYKMDADTNFGISMSKFYLSINEYDRWIHGKSKLTDKIAQYSKQNGRYNLHIQTVRGGAILKEFESFEDAESYLKEIHDAFKNGDKAFFIR